MLRQAKYSQVKIGIRDVERLQGESYRGISFRVGDAPIEGNLNMQYVFQVYPFQPRRLPPLQAGDESANFL